MYTSSVAYTNCFSTILRLARGARLSHEIVEEDYDGKEPSPKYVEKTTISFAGATSWRQAVNDDAEYELVPVQAPEPVATQDTPDEHADSHRPSTLHASNEGCEGRESNEMVLEEPVRWPQGNGSDARSHSSNVEEGDIGCSPRSGPDRVLQAPQSRSRI
jgi:hypothetical protein